MVFCKTQAAGSLLCVERFFYGNKKFSNFGNFLKTFGFGVVKTELFWMNKKCPQRFWISIFLKLARFFKTQFRMFAWLFLADFTSRLDFCVWKTISWKREFSQVDMRRASGFFKKLSANLMNFYVFSQHLKLFSFSWTKLKTKLNFDYGFCVFLIFEFQVSRSGVRIPVNAIFSAFFSSSNFLQWSINREYFLNNFIDWLIDWLIWVAIGVTAQKVASTGTRTPDLETWNLKWNCHSPCSTHSQTTL